MSLLEFRGLDRVASYLKEFPAESNKAALLAVNSAVRFASSAASRDIRSQVAFSRGYLGAAGASDAKIRISQYAKAGDLSATVAVRDRPTSLARFALGAPTFKRAPGSRGPRVRVKTGGTSVYFKHGFFVKLRRGAVLSEDQFNIGLAVRLRKGETLKGSTKATKLKGGAYLLYGPSVAQVFTTVRDDIAGDVADYVAQEFLRQFGRFARG